MKELQPFQPRKGAALDAQLFEVPANVCLDTFQPCPGGGKVVHVHAEGQELCADNAIVAFGDLQMEYLQAHLRPVVLLLHHQVQIQPPLSQIPLVLILHLFKTDYQLNDIFPVEITMKNIEIIGRTGTIPFLEMKIQNSYTLEQGILKEFISVTENLGTRKDFGHGMVERDGREKTF